MLLGFGWKREGRETYVFVWVGEVTVVHSLWDEPGASAPAEIGVFGELSWDEAAEVGLDKLSGGPLWKEIRRWEAVPFLSNADVSLCTLVKASVDMHWCVVGLENRHYSGEGEDGS